MLLTYACGSIIPMLSGGLFNTSFLTSSGINIVELGILAFIPPITKCFSIFCPSVLERFKRRKLVLAMSRFLFYTFYILGVTLIPFFVEDQRLKMALFIGCVFAANMSYAIFNGGYIVWHLNFIPDEVRVDYFSVNTLVSSALGSTASIVASIVADMLSGSPHEHTVIVVLRFIAYGIGILDVIVLSLPKEFPYKQESHPRLRDIILKPFGHKPFVMTMVIVLAYNFFLHLPASSYNYYLLNDVGVEFTMTGMISVLYSVFILVLMPVWQRVIKRVGWVQTFALCELFYIPTTIALSFVTKDNYMWLFPVVRLTQHVFAVGIGISNSNLLYVNMPETDQTNYVSFHELTLNIANFLGATAGTWFVGTFPGARVTLFGFTFCNVQMLQWACSASQLLIPLVILRMFPRKKKI
ncbi:MAG: MFS transporter [Clostridia bacterium]|nr:MFS transporter [Clostridia bacterium]